MESEKVKEIKKALEAYGNDNKGITILRSGEIQSISYTDILTYINELEKCSEKWQKLCADEVALNKTFRDKINELESENEKLNKIFTYDKSMRDRCFDFIKNTKEQALKQFAERVKMEFYYEFDELIPSIMKGKIDKILKEFIGE